MHRYVIAAVLGAVVGLSSLLAMSYLWANGWYYDTPQFRIEPEHYEAARRLLREGWDLFFYQSLVERGLEWVMPPTTLALFCVFAWDRGKAAWRRWSGSRWTRLVKKAGYEHRRITLVSCKLVIGFQILFFVAIWMLTPSYLIPYFHWTIGQLIFISSCVWEFTGVALLYGLPSSWVWEVICAAGLYRVAIRLVGTAFFIVFALPLTLTPMLGPAKIGMLGFDPLH